MNNCEHKKLTDDFEFDMLEYCPKGCDGAKMIDGRVYCEDCDETIYEVHRGHEGCKYGRY